MYAVESDGGFHNTFSKFHHKNRLGFLNSIKRDEKKEKWLVGLGFCVIRIREKDLKYLSLEWLKEKYEIDITEKFCED
jgi:very-short-patch-repair endonuclease